MIKQLTIEPGAATVRGVLLVPDRMQCPLSVPPSSLAVCAQ